MKLLPQRSSHLSSTRSRSQRRAILALAVGGLMFTSLACDNFQSDQRRADNEAKKAIEKSAVSRRTPTTQTLSQAVSDLTSAVTTSKSGSSEGKIRANSALAQAEFESADRVLRDLNTLVPQINQTMWDIAQTSAQIKKFNQMATALMATNPEPTLKAIAEKRAAMTADAQAAAKKAADLQTEIDKVKAQVAQLTQQKDAATAEADAAAEKAAKAELKDADALLDQSGESRRKAANLGHDIDKAQSALLPLERDLAAEQAKKKTADDAIAGLDANKAAAESNWQARQAQLSEQKALVARLGEDVTAKSARLADLATRADALRKQAVEFFTRSAKHSADASAEAKNLGLEAGKWMNEHPTAPERKAWEQLRTTYSPQVFKLSEAEAENALGNVHSAHAALLDARQKLVAAIQKDLQEGGVAVPPSLTAATDDPAKVTQAANAAYASAADKFLTVYSGLPGNALKDVKDAAHVARMFSLYGQYLNGDQTKLGDAKKEFQETFGDRKEDPMIKLLPAKLQG